MSTDATASNGPGGRDARGKFAPGNRCGRGNPHLARLAAAQAEVRAATTPGAVTALLDRLHAVGMAGDVAAARAWLDRCLGRPREEVSGAVLNLPPLRDASSIADAMRLVAVAAAARELPIDDASKLANILQSTVGALALADIENRLAELEQDRQA